MTYPFASAVRKFARAVQASLSPRPHRGPWRHRLAILAVAIAIAFAAHLAAATTAEEKAVIAPLQALLDGMAKHDRAAIREQLLPGGMATLLRNGQPVQMHFDTFVEHMPTPESTVKIQERIFDPVVRIDDDIAIIWAPYEFTLEGKLDHCGTDVINLVKRDNRWLISAIADNTHHTCTPR
jgi:hypothetical protein